jgi:hypothetical protein
MLWKLATCIQVITVFDNTPPVITPANPHYRIPNNGTIEARMCYGQDPRNYQHYPADATDNCTGTVGSILMIP